MSGPARNGWRGTAGFSLIEMMVAMVIALVALGAVGGLYLSSSQTARYYAAVQRVQENGRFAADMMSRSLRMGGYDDPLDDDEDLGDGLGYELPAVWLKGTISSSGTIITQTGLKSTGDTVGVSYQGGADIRDCQGRSVGNNVFVTNMYAVSTTNQLVCSSQHSTGTTYAAVPLAEGVEDMQVLYGLDIDDDGIANRYVPANNVADWNEVVSMRITLLINSIAAALVDPATVCMGCVVFAGVNDRLVRAEFETTIGIRNTAAGS